MTDAALQDWVHRNKGTPGVLAFGIHGPGTSSFIESCATNVLPQALKAAWRCVAETISVLQFNQFPTARFRFIYGQALVHCERRRDGACLGIFAQKDPGQFTRGELERLLSEFHAL